MNGDTTRGAVTVALELNTLPALKEFCGVLAKTDMVPKAYKEKPDDILVAILHGQEVGLPHLQALQSIAVVNGIPSIYGDAALAMVRASGKLEDFDEWIEVDGARMDGSFPILKWAEEGKVIVAHCRSKRIGMSRERITTYSVDDAQRAKLWLKKGQNGFETPWCTVPQRMLMWRARGWNLRDQFGDVLKGLAIYEEAMDIETSKAGDGSYRVVSPDQSKLKAQLEDGREKLKQQQASPPLELERSALSEQVNAQPQEAAQPEKADSAAMPEPTATLLYQGYAKELRAADSTAAIAAVMNRALNSPDSLMSPDERRSIQLLREKCMEKLRKKKK